jgi:hypothetical protein
MRMAASGDKLQLRRGRTVDRTLIDPPGAVVDQPLGGLDILRHVRKLAGDHLVLDDRYATDNPGLGDSERGVEGAPRMMLRPKMFLAPEVQMSKCTKPEAEVPLEALCEREGAS